MDALQAKVQQVLTFLRLTDADGTLSLTSLTLIVALYKVAMAPKLEIAGLVAFIGAMSMYSGKKVIAGKALSNEVGGEVEGLKETMTALANKVQTLDNRTNPNNLRR